MMKNNVFLSFFHSISIDFIFKFMLLLTSSLYFGTMNMIQGNYLQLISDATSWVASVKYLRPSKEGLLTVASLEGRRGQPAPDVTILGWHHFKMWNHKPTNLWQRLFLLFDLVPILIWTEIALNFRRRTFFGLHLLLDRKPTQVSAKTFIFFIFWSSPTLRHNFHKGGDTTKFGPGSHHL